MELLDVIEVQSHWGTHRIELLKGDLTKIPSEHAVDVLVTSAFPNDYAPTHTSLIGALNRIGVSVRDLSGDKAVDIREAFSCWMSKDLQNAEAVGFKRILVFEPLVRGRPSDVVGDIFQSLMPFIHVDPYVKKIAMPLVATGNQGISPQRILEPLIQAAVNWFLLGLPVEVIKIVERNEHKALQLQGAFSILKQQYSPHQAPKKSEQEIEYDFFISYARETSNAVDILHDALKDNAPDKRIFVDRHNLQVGAAWQQELYETMDHCAKIITLYSPSYLASKVCKEEYNIALMRHREEGNILVPIYIETASLPTYMRLINFIDCREMNEQKLRDASKLILGY